LLHSPGRPNDLLANQQGAGWEACRTHGIMEWHKRSRASGLAGRTLEMKAFLKSTCSRSHPVGATGGCSNLYSQESCPMGSLPYTRPGSRELADSDQARCLPSFPVPHLPRASLGASDTWRIPLSGGVLLPRNQMDGVPSEHMVQRDSHLANPPGPRPQSCLRRHPPPRGTPLGSACTIAGSSPLRGSNQGPS